MFVPIDSDFSAPLSDNEDDGDNDPRARLIQTLNHLESHAAHVDANFRTMALREAERLRAICLHQERIQIEQHFNGRIPWPQTVGPLPHDDEKQMLHNLAATPKRPPSPPLTPFAAARRP